jgi:hypothetical protein
MIRSVLILTTAGLTFSTALTIGSSLGDKAHNGPTPNPSMMMIAHFTLQKIIPALTHTSRQETHPFVKESNPLP